MVGEKSKGNGNIKKRNLDSTEGFVAPRISSVPTVETCFLYRSSLRTHAEVTKKRNNQKYAPSELLAEGKD